MLRNEVISYRPEHQPDVEGFFNEVKDGTAFPFDPEGAHADVRHIHKEYQRDGGGFWLCRRGNQLIGTVGIRRLERRVAELKRLFILEGYRGRGVGGMLVRHALDHCRGVGFEAVRLDTLSSSEAAVRCFRRHGFVEIDRYNDNPDSNVFMECRLNRGR